MNRCPDNGSASSRERTKAKSPSNPRRISTGSGQNHSLTAGERLNTMALPEQRQGNGPRPGHNPAANAGRHPWSGRVRRPVPRVGAGRTADVVRDPAWILRRGALLSLGSEAAFPEVEGGQGNGLDGAELCDGKAGSREACQSIHPEFACGGTGSRGGADRRSNDDFGHRNTSQRAGDPSKLSDVSRT